MLGSKSALAASSGWGERKDRAGLPLQLANLPTPPGKRTDQHVGEGQRAMLLADNDDV